MVPDPESGCRPLSTTWLCPTSHCSQQLLPALVGSACSGSFLPCSMHRDPGDTAQPKLLKELSPQKGRGFFRGRTSAWVFLLPVNLQLQVRSPADLLQRACLPVTQGNLAGEPVRGGKGLLAHTGTSRKSLHTHVLTGGSLQTLSRVLLSSAPRSSLPGAYAVI